MGRSPLYESPLRMKQPVVGPFPWALVGSFPWALVAPFLPSEARHALSEATRFAAANWTRPTKNCTHHRLNAKHNRLNLAQNTD